MADPKGKPNKKPSAEAFKDVAIGDDGVYRVSGVDQPGPETKSETKSEAKSDSKPEAKPAPQPEPKATASAASSSSSSSSGAASAASAAPAKGAASTASPPPPPPSSGSGGGSSSGGGSGFGKTALTAVGALVAGALLAFWLAPKLTGSERLQQLAAQNEQRLNDISGKVDLFAGQANALNEAAGRVNALDARVESMAGGLSALEGSLAGQPANDDAGPRLAALGERIDGLEKALSALSDQHAALVQSAGAAAAPTQDPAVAKRLDDFEGRLAAVVEAVSAPPPAPVLPEAAASRISELEARVSSLTDTLSGALAPRANENGEPVEAAAPSAESVKAAADAAAALAATQGLEGRLSAFSAVADETSALSRQISALGARLDAGLQAAQEARASAPPAASAEDLATLRASLDELTARVEFAAESATPPVGFADLEALPSRADLDALTERLSAMEGDLVAARSVTVNTALAVSAADLQSAASGSAPFIAQLNNFAQVSGQTPDSALTIYARTGVPTLATLLASFGEAERAALQAEDSERARVAESLGDKLSGAMSSLVAVRRTAESTGVDSASILTRARARLNEGDLASALAELETLQAAPRAGMADWLRGAQARRNVEESLARLRQNLLTAPSAE